jgi:hypothetical protein
MRWKKYRRANEKFERYEDIRDERIARIAARFMRRRGPER